MNRPPHHRKRLLVASLGVATVIYATQGVGCTDKGRDIEWSGNLMPPPPSMDAGVDTPDADIPSSGNLLPPPPLDATVQDEDASTDDDASADESETPAP